MTWHENVSENIDSVADALNLVFVFIILCIILFT
jgi:hypothetical protein